MIRFYALIFAFYILGIQNNVQGISEESYDFIVVGGGTAGCVVASRLSENPKFRVLVLEAGDYPDPALDIPALAPNATFAPTFSPIKVYTENGVPSYITGRVLGGGSSINAIFFNRGSPMDYDNWAKMTGDESWSYESMLKYFKRIEDYQGDFMTDQRGLGGPITISRPKYAPGADVWMEAGKYLGYTTDVDPNGPQRISFARADHNKKFGRRVSSYTGYIKQIIDTRPNLKVVSGAKVSRVLFEGQRAVGVVYSTGTFKNSQFARCTKEIILSAGVMESPAILMRSGIGPKEILEESKIQPVSVLPVGRNLQSHIGLALEMVMNSSLVFDEARDLTPETWKIFNSLGDGPYTSWAGAHSQVFLRTPHSIISPHLSFSENENWANVHSIVMFGGGSIPFFGYRHEEIRMAPWEGPAVYFPYLSRPRSKGILKLNSTNIEGDPIIDFQFLTYPEDEDALLYAIKHFLNVIENTPSFNRSRARYPPNSLRACENLTFRSDEYWRCYIRHKAGSALHAGGTCSMGRGRNDPDAVVDTTLKVIGVQGLRVADTSIMPAIVNTNTQAAAMVIGEKVSEMILSDIS